MDKGKKIVIGIFIGVIIITASALSIYYSILNNSDNEPDKQSPIVIQSDEDFQSGFPGSGTKENPYIIEFYNIRNQGGIAISISDTTKHFIIRNCSLLYGSYGIKLDNVANGTAVIIDNICTTNYGIYIENADGAFIDNNFCSLEEGYGIYVSSCSNVEIKNNNLEYRFQGIYLTYSSHIKVVNNTCNYNSVSGISVFYTSEITLIRNRCSFCENVGILVNFYVTNVILIENVCNSNIEGINFHADNCVVANNTCLENYDGIIIHTDNTNITNNNCSNNNNRGMSLYTNNCNLFGNNFKNNSVIGLDLFLSSNAIIRNNTLTNNYEGISLDRCSFTTIRNNTCIANQRGILISGCTNITIINNTINENYRGVDFIESENCTFVFNLFKENSYYGIDDDSSVGMNYIYNNNFIDNNLGGSSQAYDYQTANLWYNSLTNEGNYWSDWIGSGPYYIDGNANATDPYPLSNPIYP